MSDEKSAGMFWMALEAVRLLADEMDIAQADLPPKADAICPEVKPAGLLADAAVMPSLLARQDR